MKKLFLLAKERVWKSFKEFLYLFTFASIILAYLFGSIYLYLFLEDNTSIDKNYIGWLIFAYLFFGFVIFYYAYGAMRRKTKNIKIILRQDFIDFKKALKKIIQDILALAKSLTILAGVILAIGAIIMLLVLFGWIIASLSATTIIIVLLVIIIMQNYEKN